MKNLVIGVVGDSSLHKNWISGATPDFDLFLVYYGELGNRYRNDAMYYDFAKGTKFLIIDAMIKKHKEVFDHYDAIFIPDDDILIDTIGINRFFSIFHRYHLVIAQPAIIGWLSMTEATPQFDKILRYVRCVEIMTPCFSKDALSICQPSFTENKTNWGIDWLWFNLLGEPQDKLAVIDDVVAVHTRPCFFGDTYWRNNNNFEIAYKDLMDITSRSDIRCVNDSFGFVSRDIKEWMDQPSEHKFFPNCPAFINLLLNKRSDDIML